ncbi:MAG: hypothetical protein LBS35_11545 [Synergistaceae bacterium]|jgi:hypothetical protein|nr:hypothetical protein [Synergistaceae bacterium]
MEFDVEKIVDIVTREILRRLDDNGPENSKVLVTEGCPDDLVSGDYSCVRGDDADSCKYVILTAGAYMALKGRTEPNDPDAPAPSRCDGGLPDSPDDCCSGAVTDLRGKRLLHERDLREKNVARGSVVKVSKKTIVTALANDYAKGIGARIVREN